MDNQLYAMKLDRKFKALSFSEQQQTVAAYLQRQLAGNQQFLSLSPADQSATAQAIWQKEVLELTPSLNAYSGALTDSDRLALASPGGGQTGLGTQESYKRGLWLLERVRGGDATATAEAQQWIYRNSAGTNSLLAAIAAGSKDAIEVLTGQDTEYGNNLLLNSQDFGKLADALEASMPRQEGQTARTWSTTIGLGVNFTENILLNALLGGSISQPGLFTKRLWSKVAERNAADLVIGKSPVMATLRAPLVQGVSGGIIDLVRQFPKLVETGKVQGPAEGLVKAATVFGEGFAYDFVFNAAKDFAKYAWYPAKRLATGFKLTDPNNEASVGAALAGMQEDNFSDGLTKYLNGEIPSELQAQLSPELQAEFARKAATTSALLKNFDFDVNSPEGFKILARAMGGYDVDINPSGGISLLDDSGKVIQEFADRNQAIAHFMSEGFQNSKAFTNLDDYILGGSPESTIRLYTPTTTTVKELSDNQLVLMMRDSGLRGTIDQDTTSQALTELGNRLGKTVKVSFTDEASFLKSSVLGEADTLVLPETITSNATKNQLDTLLKPFTSRVTTQSLFDLRSAGASEDALNTVLGRIGGSVTRSGEGFQVVWPGQTKPLQYDDLKSLNADVWKYLMEGGFVTEDDYAVLLKRSSGYTLDVKLDEQTGLKTYEIWAPSIRKGGKPHLLQASNSLEGLSESAPMYNVKFPQNLLPDLMINDSGKLVIGKTVASGSTSSLMHLLKDFDDSGSIHDILGGKTGSTIEKVLGDGTSVQVTTAPGKQIVFEDPATGTIKYFSTTKDLSEFLDTLSTGWNRIQSEAASKGFRAVSLGSGQTLFTDGQQQFVTASYKEAQEFLGKQASVPQNGPELLKLFDDETNMNLYKSMQDQADALTGDEWAPRYKTLSKGQGSLKAFAGSKVSPNLDYLVRMGEQYNHPELGEAARSITVARNAYFGKMNRDVRPFINTLFTDPDTGKLIDSDTSKILMHLTELDESSWSQWLSVHSPDFDLKPSYVNMVHNTQKYLDGLGSTFGIDILGWMKNYVPHLREKTPETIASVLDAAESRNDATKILFGEALDDSPEMKLLFRNSRLDSSLSALQQEDLIKAVTFYAERGYRDYYLKPVADKMWDVIQGLGDDLNPSIKASAVNAYANLVGGVDDQLGHQLNEVSFSVTKKLAEKVRLLGQVSGGDASALGRAIDKIADNMVTEDAVGQVQKNISLATLGFRPIRALTNTAQYLNTWALYGKYALDAVDEVDDDTVRALVQRGIVNGQLFSSMNDEVSLVGGKTFSDIAMAPQENSEILTRSWTATAAGLAFDDYLPGLQAGNYDFSTFVKRAKFSWMEDRDIQQVLSLLQGNQPEAARNLVMTQAVRKTMFDYAKENSPGVFQGTLGRIFGKFGVYPVGQVEFYRSILKNSDPAELVLRSARLVTGAALIKNSFKAVGIEYAGFNLLDPLSFSGGPLWSSLIDSTHVFDTGPEGAFARTNLMRSWLPVTYSQSKGLQPNVPRLLVPGASQINSIIQAMQSLNDGDYWGAFLESMGASRSRTPWTHLEQPFF